MPNKASTCKWDAAYDRADTLYASLLSTFNQLQPMDSFPQSAEVTHKVSCEEWKKLHPCSWIRSSTHFMSVFFVYISTEKEPNTYLYSTGYSSNFSPGYLVIKSYLSVFSCNVPCLEIAWALVNALFSDEITWDRSS